MPRTQTVKSLVKHLTGGLVIGLSMILTGCGWTVRQVSTPVEELGPATTFIARTKISNTGRFVELFSVQNFDGQVINSIVCYVPNEARIAAGGSGPLGWLRDGFLMGEGEFVVSPGLSEEAESEARRWLAAQHGVVGLVPCRVDQITISNLGVEIPNLEIEMNHGWSGSFPLWFVRLTLRNNIAAVQEIRKLIESNTGLLLRAEGFLANVGDRVVLPVFIATGQ